MRLQLFSLPVVRDADSVGAHEWIANDAIRQLRNASPENKLNLPADLKTHLENEAKQAFAAA